MSDRQRQDDAVYITEQEDLLLAEDIVHALDASVVQSVNRALAVALQPIARQAMRYALTVPPNGQANPMPLSTTGQEKPPPGPEWPHAAPMPVCPNLSHLPTTNIRHNHPPVPRLYPTPLPQAMPLTPLVRPCQIQMTTLAQSGADIPLMNDTPPTPSSEGTAPMSCRLQLRWFQEQLQLRLCDGPAGACPHNFPTCAAAASGDPETNGTTTNHGGVARSRQEDGRTRGLASGAQREEVPGGKANKELGGGATEAIEERTGETRELFVPTGGQEDVNPGSGIHRGEDRRNQGAVRPDRGMGRRQSGN
ncbi:hypothetical protein NDU88_003503 [Pleurodeles waltl]|uniref:Uncharacterized protein n=1 Tax=Pleurodeles waltl TaxID=8319 RepID=A0AAV7KZ56_PLEWA|nr:hypothetical protein NDU88_003503 [Pleurodeles waltl]